MRKLILSAVLVLATAMPALAQDRPFGINFGGGWIFPTGEIGNTFDAGWNGTIGGTVYFTPQLGFQAEYMYGRMGGPDRTINVSPSPGGIPNPQLIESNHQMHVGTFNLVYSPTAGRSGSSPVGFYAVGGAGIYHRIIQLTSPAVGFTTICDPYWLVCYPTAVEVDRILGDRSSNDFGINLGAGVTFGTDAKFYVETRWHYVWGPEITASGTGTLPAGGTINCSNGCSTNASYFPLTFGVRW
jgi:hypothetical protein